MTRAQVLPKPNRAAMRLEARGRMQWPVLILRDGASRLLRMRLPKTRAPRWLVRTLYFPVFLQTPISGLPEIGAQCAQVG